MNVQRLVVERPTARVIVVDGACRVLLFQIEDLPFPSPLDPDPKQPRIYWVTPGGGVELGETFEAAACRELLEETGLVADPLGPCLLEREVLAPKPDRDIHYLMRFFLVRVAAAEVSLDGLDPIERGAYRDHRWWTLAELETTTETVYPPRLPEILRGACSALPAGREG